MCYEAAPAPASTCCLVGVVDLAPGNVNRGFCVGGQLGHRPVRQNRDIESVCREDNVTSEEINRAAFCNWGGEAWLQVVWSSPRPHRNAPGILAIKIVLTFTERSSGARHYHTDSRNVGSTQSSFESSVSSEIVIDDLFLMDDRGVMTVDDSVKNCTVHRD
jgi:hypothetical protein